MGVLTERVEQGVNALAEKWKDKLGGWAVNWAAKSIEKSLDDMEPELVDQAKEYIATLQAIPDLPPEIKNLLDKAAKPKSFAFVPFLIGILVAMVMSTVMGAFKPWAMKVSQQVDSLARSVKLPSEIVLPLWWRNPDKWKEYLDDLAKLGISDNRIETLKESSLHSLDKRDVQEAWLRDKTIYNDLWGQVEDDALTPDRIKLYQELAYKVAGVQDVIRFAVREVYTPEIAEKFRQFEDFPELAVPDAEKVGIRKELLKQYWAAHWELPGVSQGYEMFHRGVIDEETLKVLLRARDVMPFWRDKLLKISYNVYNRIDVRRMWDLGVLDDTALLKAYKDMGYDEEHANKLVLWTKLFIRVPEIIARYKNGYINRDSVLSQITALGASVELAQFLFETKVAVEKPARVAAEKDLTKAEIIKGVKTGVISWEEGIERLMALGYDEEEAMFILAINIEAETGSPGSPAEFKRLTELYRASQGMPTRRTLQEIAASEKAVAAKYPIKAKVSDEQLKVSVDTIRRKRRSNKLTRDEEVIAFLELGLDVRLAEAYADNDDLRIRQEKVEE